jgi:hypothetical protein
MVVVRSVVLITLLLVACEAPEKSPTLASEGTGGAGVGESGASTSSMLDLCRDNDDCIIAKVSANGVCAHEYASVGTSCKSGTGWCDATGKCVVDDAAGTTGSGPAPWPNDPPVEGACLFLPQFTSRCPPGGQLWACNRKAPFEPGACLPATGFCLPQAPPADYPEAWGEISLLCCNLCASH